MRVIVCGKLDFTPYTQEELDICADVAKGNPPPGPNMLVIRNVGPQGTTSLTTWGNVEPQQPKHKPAWWKNIVRFTNKLVSGTRSGGALLQLRNCTRS